MLIENLFLIVVFLLPILLAATIADGIGWLAERKARQLPRARVTRV